MKLGIMGLWRNACHSAAISYKVGYRRRGSGRFELLENPPCCWCADPFLFERDGRTYVFAEAYDPFRGRGSIRYCELPEGGGRARWHEAIAEPYHMSYPFIWEDGDGIHICAETCGIGDIHAYDCVHFPDAWRRGRTLATGRRYADSTLVLDGEGNPAWCFTHEVTGPLRGNLFRYAFRDGQLDEASETFLTDDPAVCRPGGQFFERDGKLVRVAQDGRERYGERVLFLEVESMEPYRERPAGELSYREHPYVKGAIGLHTYNVAGDWEVVDFRIRGFNWLRFFCALARGIAGKLKRMAQGHRKGGAAW